MRVDIRPFGQSPAGEPADLITLTNDRGESVSLTNYGGHIVSIMVRDRRGNLGEVCLGQDSAEDYARRDIGYMGGTIGRYGNRISGAAFTLNGEEYALYANDGRNTLHGGQEGFNRKLWAYEVDRNSVIMRYTSPDMEEGFPGALSVEVRFTFSEDAALRIDYLARTDKETHVNLTNHAYFNLGDSPDILGHTLWVDADRVIEVDGELIPTGVLMSVAGTPYDLRQPQPLGEVMRREDNAMFAAAKGFDIGYVLNGGGMRQIARLHDPDSGRVMTVSTDQPGVQCYSGQGFNCGCRAGHHYCAYAGIALETQQHPDTLHQPSFGTTLLQPGQAYQTSTIYAFTAE